jgi:hypothetical protein
MLRGRDGFNSQKEVCGNTVSREKDAFQRRTTFQRKNGFPEKDCLPRKTRAAGTLTASGKRSPLTRFLSDTEKDRKSSTNFRFVSRQESIMP